MDPSEETISPEDREYYLEFLKAQVSVISQRNQFLLLFQSMLFGAMGVLVGKEGFFPLWVIILLGVVTSAVWLYLNALAHTNERYVEDRLKACDERYAGVVRSRRRFWILSFGNSSALIAYFFPCAMIVAWLIVWGFYLAR